MSSAQDTARKHIESIRAKYKLPGNDEDIDHDDLIVRGFKSALKILSEQIYPDEYHFIWELIQNNDDAAYKVARPELRIILTNDNLFVWSNQVGFSRKDVESICRLGESSKIAKVDTIGEKGIGFKSLFTVADSVTIKSDPYHFKFDTTTALGNLGMLVPTWVGRPNNLGPAGTQLPKEGTLVSLHLKSKINLAELQSRLKQLHCDFLIFCRRLCKIEVSCTVTNLAFVKTVELSDKTTDTVFLHVQDNAAGQNWKLKFRMFSRELKGMPQQPERPNQTNSIVRLAFPLPKNWSTGLIEEKTYAFMPMKSYGFNFMIHANFILIANRGEVAKFHEWNKKLRDGLSDLIHSAIVWFATSPASPTSVQWLRYVYSLYSVKDAFFGSLADEVCRRLRNTPLLSTESADASVFQMPPRGLLISEDYRSDGKLILDVIGVAKRSISRNYNEDPALKEVLKKLGVLDFTHTDFLHEFGNMVRRDAVSFRSKPLQWHSVVAKALLSARHRAQQAFLQSCQGLEIVPLVSGEWTTPQPNTVFLPGEDMQDIPSSLAVKIVETAACQDRDRRFLFEALGLRACNREQICKSIMVRRSNHQGDTLQDTVSQLKFLYLANYEPNANDFFMFYQTTTESDNADPAIHIPFGSVGSEIKLQLGHAAKQLRWLASGYGAIAVEGRAEHFTEWLKKWPQLRLWPEVCRNHRLTEVFTKMLATEGSKNLLVHLWFRVSLGQALPTQDADWKSAMRNLEVKTDRGSKKLCETALPNIASLSEGMIPSLDIPVSAEMNWQFLSAFGVITSIDARFLRQRLRNIKSSNEANSMQNTISKIYHDLGKLTGEQELIRRSFEAEDLVYLGQRGWVNLRPCRWNASYQCTVFPLLSKIYPDCSRLFKHMLGIRSANTNDLLAELRSRSIIAPVDDMDVETAETIYQLLLELNKMFVDKAATHAQVNDMKTIKIFPIFNDGTRPEAISMRLLKSMDTFWIGDMPSLQSRFSGKLPLLLPMHGTTTSDLNNIYQTLGMEGKKLTECVNSTVVSDGHIGSTDEQLTRALKPKVPYLISLLKYVEEVKDNRDTFVSQLGDLCVQRVKGITLRRYVKDGGRRIYGTDEEGEICLKPEAKRLIVHVDIEMETPDFLASLADHLNQYWGLNYRHSHLVNKVFSSTSSKRYIEEFEKAGIIIDSIDEQNDLWNSPQRKTRKPETKSKSEVNDTELDGILPPSPRHREEVIYISDDEKHDDDQIMIDSVAAPVRPRVNKPATELDLAKVKQMISKTTSISLVDDTENQHRSVFGRRQPLPGFGVSTSFDRPPAGLASARSSNAPPVREDTPNKIENIYSGRTRGTAAHRATAGQPRRLPSSDLEVEIGIMSQNHGSSRPGIPTSLHEPPNQDSSSHKPRKRPRLDEESDLNMQDETITQLIGKAGEQQVYKFLSELLGSSISHENWTSANRIAMFPEHPFRGEEWRHADFTYKDTDSRLGNYLASKVPGFSTRGFRLRQPTYHLEVKTTISGINEPAILRNNQIRLAREFSNAVPLNGSAQNDHVYVLVRVYDLRMDDSSAPKICFFPDPWSLIYRGKLLIEGDEGVYVRPGSL